MLDTKQLCRVGKLDLLKELYLVDQTIRNVNQNKVPAPKKISTESSSTIQGVSSFEDTTVTNLLVESDNIIDRIPLRNSVNKNQNITIDSASSIQGVSSFEVTTVTNVLVESDNIIDRILLPNSVDTLFGTRTKGVENDHDFEEFNIQPLPPDIFEETYSDLEGNESQISYLSSVSFEEHPINQIDEVFSEDLNETLFEENDFLSVPFEFISKYRTYCAKGKTLILFIVRGRVFGESSSNVKISQCSSFSTRTPKCEYSDSYCQ